MAKKLELARAEKTIGHSLNAKVTIHANGEQYDFIKSVEDQLLQVFIVSDLEIVKDDKKDEDSTLQIAVEISVAEGEKCERCWMYSKTVGEDKENPGICHRCSENLK